MKKIVLVLVVLSLFSFAAFAQDDGDTEPPRVVATHPANGAKGVRTSATIHMTFSEEMDPSCFSNRTFRLRARQGDKIDGMVTYANKSVGFMPLSRLSESTTYIATIDGEATDSAGNDMGRDYSWTFTTGMQ